MKRLLIAYIIAALAPLAVRAQANVQPNVQPNDSTTFRCTIENAEYQVWFDIDFYGQSISVPDAELFGELPGYMGAKRDPRKWLITAAELTSPTEAQLEIINDYGSEDLTASLTLLPDGTYLLRQLEGSTLRIVVNNKWLKLPKTLVLKRKPTPALSKGGE